MPSCHPYDLVMTTSEQAGNALRVGTIDYHTAGEPFRIVRDGAPPVLGQSVAERRMYAKRDKAIDRVRQLLVREPRGHADMYGCFVVPPDDDGAHLGAVFWHQDGYSTACGHGTIALGVWAVESGIVTADPDGDTEVVIDVPSGRVTARVTCVAGRIAQVAFRNVHSYVLARSVPVSTSRGEFAADVSYGGAIYVSVHAAHAGLRVEPESYRQLVEFGHEVKRLLDPTEYARHPTDDRLSGIYGTILYDELPDTADGPHQRNITIFADGEADRSPCGSGTSARVALLAAEGRLGPNEVLTHDSVIGSRFTARAGVGAHNGTVVPEVMGMAYRTGEHVFVLADDDPLGTGFVLR